uniref:TRAF interacting protein with forkhead associated domain n=1 Tax=Neolamprologus brichardi TaxID=32507 RepID=A0A3Q4GB96_NEOBR
RSSFRYCETDIMFLPCLQIKLYHPQQSCKGFYGHLPLGTRRRHTADDPLRLGRDTEACAYILLDPRVSHKQLALYAYHIPQSSEMLFTIQNLSQRGKLSVNTSALGYLERMDLPDKIMFDVTANYTHFEFMEMVYRGLYLEHKPIWLIETGLSRDQIKQLQL